ncbi:DUF2267 domain-containing protein [Blastococcus sp. HT6-30]|uniref:DUF2267 domain-containing protein n=1 Tax=Blastococcus sp. HT6-30 TaxID=3144843 RepID=UPI0032190A39
MRYDEFLARVREQGGYADRSEADRTARVVLGLLSQRLVDGERKDLAAQLPGELQDAVLTAPSQEVFGVEEFLRRIARELSATEETARWDASAVLTTLAGAISGGEVNQILTQLPAGYAPLFGKTDLA